MADGKIKPQSAFERAAANVQNARKSGASAPASSVAASAPVQPRSSAQKRAALNVIPDNALLAARIEQALAALSRGVRWVRGSIINLIV